jgi:exonuclease III
MLTPSFTNIERQGMTELLALGFSDVYRTLHP